LLDRLLLKEKTRIMLYVSLVSIVALSLLGAVAYYLKKSGREPEQKSPSRPVDSECCGAHAVCERDRLLTMQQEVVYFDDEELDVLAGKNSEDYTSEELKMIEDVFYTLRESDVAGWLCSLQLRNIKLPQYLKDEALLIVSERRRS